MVVRILNFQSQPIQTVVHCLGESEVNGDDDDDDDDDDDKVDIPLRGLS